MLGGNLERLSFEFCPINLSHLEELPGYLSHMMATVNTSTINNSKLFKQLDFCVRTRGEGLITVSRDLDDTSLRTFSNIDKLVMESDLLSRYKSSKSSRFRFHFNFDRELVSYIVVMKGCLQKLDQEGLLHFKMGSHLLDKYGLYRPYIR
jgi:hypothetical protein